MSRIDELMGIRDPSDDEEHARDSDDEEKGRQKRVRRQSASADDDSNAESDDEPAEGGNKAAISKVISEEEGRKRLKEIKKSGVVYLSTIPPYMKPAKVKQILERFGEVGRLFLAPEDAKAYSRRVKSGGNRKKKFVEGWVEFRNKKNAKLAVQALNGHPLGGKKGSFYYDDILNLKYLPKFKWHDLTEQIALEAQERQEKLKAEIAQATRENRIFIDNVETKERLERRKRRANDGEPDAQRTPDGPGVKRQFSQKPSKPKAGRGSSSEALSNVLSKVF